MRGARIVMLSLVASLSFASGAAAQATEGAFQLALSTDLVSYSSVSLEADEFDDDLETKTTRWGLRDQVEIELGYGVGELVVIGAFVTLGGASQELEEGDESREASELTAAIGPKVDVLLSPGAAVRPLVSAYVGFATSSQEVVGGLEQSITGFELGARLGLHWFATEGFSLMPAAMFSYASGSGDIEADGSPESIDISSSGFQIALMLGASGWI
jgi:hypothetical protein